MGIKLNYKINTTIEMGSARAVILTGVAIVAVIAFLGQAK